LETEFIVVRHGQTEWNRQGRIQGHLDSPLTAEGRAQAEAIARRLAGTPVEAIWCSDLGRVLDTAAPAARTLGLTVRTDARLRERQLGLFQGLTFAEASEAHPGRFSRFRARDLGEDMLDGETLPQMRDRVAEVLGAIAAAHPAATVLVVTHGGVLDQVYRLATGMPLDAPRSFDVENASINRLRWSSGRLSLQMWGDVSHHGDVPGAADF
jgi:probable phosphoglycerate mutase